MLLILKIFRKSSLHPGNDREVLALVASTVEPVYLARGTQYNPEKLTSSKTGTTINARSLLSIYAHGI